MRNQFLTHQAHRVQAEKRETWENIKTNMPELAEFMIELSYAFGKLENVKYERT